METPLLLILGACLSFAALLYYFLIIKRETDLGWRGRSGIFVIIFVITPVLLIVLFNQSGAEDRLRKTGFNPYPDFSSSVGTATGTGEKPIWLFSTDSKADSVLLFYKEEKNHHGWSLIAEDHNKLVFEKGRQTMSIRIDNGNVLFSLGPDE